MLTNAEYERRVTDDSGVAGPVAGNNPPWLNSVEAVSAIVRQFTADFIRRYGVVDHQRLMAWLAPECNNMNALFIGGGLLTQPYRLGPWNTPEQLGTHISVALGISGELRWAVRDAFMLYASKIGALAREHQEEDQADAYQTALATAVSEFANQLLGLDGAGE